MASHLGHHFFHLWRVNATENVSGGEDTQQRITEIACPFLFHILSGDQLTQKDETFTQRISASLLSEIPKKLTPQEITAIKKRSIFRGMSKDALYYSLGLPKSENDWGRGGKQFVYTDTLMVYLDNQNKIVDWQSLSN